MYIWTWMRVYIKWFIKSVSYEGELPLPILVCSIQGAVRNTQKAGNSCDLERVSDIIKIHNWYNRIKKNEKQTKQKQKTRSLQGRICQCM